MIFSRNLITKILPEFKNISDAEFQKAVLSTGNELPSKDIFKHPTLNNVVIGKLVSFEKHPDSDHMNVCKVQTSESDFRTIVCGAGNLVASKHIIVALPGAKLHDGRLIEEKDLRGVKSQGMICSYNELTPLNSEVVSKLDAEGVMLFEDGIIGDTNVAKFLGLDDTLYQIEVPYSNRHDIEGALAFCQDIAAYFNWKIDWAQIKEHAKTLDINLSYDKALCNGFILSKLENVNMKQSNWELKGLLMNNKFKPLNNLLDELNYITLLTNVPTAAYDAKNISNISVTTAKSGETFTGFDTKTYNLNDKDIVIRNNSEVICLAAIMGDNKFGVNNDTKTAYIEIANFNHVNIRKTAQKFAIRTDASWRNSKEITTYMTAIAGELFLNKFGNNVTGVDWNIIPNEPITTKLDLNYISTIIGEEITKERAEKNLTALGFEIKNDIVYFPRWRNDLISTPDLAEEILKKIDINNDLEEEPIVSSYENPVSKLTDQYFIMKLWDVLTNNYFNEVKTYNLTSKNNLNKFNIFNYTNNIEITSASQEDRKWFRNNLFLEMLEIYEFNAKKKNKLLPIFELQKIFQAEENFSVINSCSWNLTILTPKEHNIDPISGSKIVYNVSGLIGIANAVANIFNTKLSFEKTTTNYSYDNETVSIKINNKVIGYIGSIKKTILKNYSINEEIYFLTINWDELMNNKKQSQFFNASTLNISPLMNLYKDITFIHKNDKSLNIVFDELTQLNFLSSYEFLYKFIDKENIMSYTLRFNFINQNNLSNDTINNWMNEIIATFQKHGFELKK